MTIFNKKLFILFSSTGCFLLSSLSHKILATEPELLSLRLTEIDLFVEQLRHAVADVGKILSHQDEKITLIIGPTGAGKSSLMNAVVPENHLFFKGEELELSVRGKEIFKAGHSLTESFTTDPMRWKSPNPNDGVYYDCPGFWDTRVTMIGEITCPQQAIINMFFIKHLVERAKEIRVLTFITKGAFEERAKTLTDTIMMLNSFLPIESHASCLGLVVNKFKGGTGKLKTKLLEIKEDSEIEGGADFFILSNFLASVLDYNRVAAVRTLTPKHEDSAVEYTLESTVFSDFKTLVELLPFCTHTNPTVHPAFTQDIIVSVNHFGEKIRNEMCDAWGNFGIYIDGYNSRNFSQKSLSAKKQSLEEIRKIKTMLSIDEKSTQTAKDLVQRLKTVKLINREKDAVNYLDLIVTRYNFVQFMEEIAPSADIVDEIWKSGVRSAHESVSNTLRNSLVSFQEEVGYEIRDLVRKINDIFYDYINTEFTRTDQKSIEELKGQIPERRRLIAVLTRELKFSNDPLVVLRGSGSLDLLKTFGIRRDLFIDEEAVLELDVYLSFLQENSQIINSENWNNSIEYLVGILDQSFNHMTSSLDGKVQKAAENAAYQEQLKIYKEQVRLENERREAEKRRQEALYAEQQRRLQILEEQRATEQRKINRGVELFNLAGEYDNSGSHARAFEICLEAANLDHARAQYSVGEMYQSGRGVSQSDHEAFKWYEKSARQGDRFAQNSLGVYYNTGRVVNRDPYMAFQWYEKAAIAGHSTSQYCLGHMYSTGQAVIKDPYEAVKWFRRAANQGYVSAYGKLGLAYAKGEGVMKSESEAIKWIRKAAREGDENSQSYLRECGLSW